VYYIFVECCLEDGGNMSFLLWVIIIIVAILVVLMIIGMIVSKNEQKSGNVQVSSKKEQRPKKEYMIDAAVVKEIRNLLNIVDNEARIRSSPKSEKWLECDRRLREIGEQLYDQGGEDLMKFVFTMVYQDTSLRGHYLNDAWDRVGSWWV